MAVAGRGVVQRLEGRGCAVVVLQRVWQHAGHSEKSIMQTQAIRESIYSRDLSRHVRARLESQHL